MKSIYVFALIITAVTCKMCAIKRRNCGRCEVKPDEAITVAYSQKTAFFCNELYGSIGSKTLSSMSDVEELQLFSQDLQLVEDTMLCSLPKLKVLHVGHIIPRDVNLTIIKATHFPNITKMTLGKCSMLETLYVSNVMFDPSALQSTPNLHKLTLNRIDIPVLTSEYFRPLEILEEFIYVDGKIEEIDPYSLCLPANLMKIEMYPFLIPPLMKEHFTGCNKVENITILAYTPNTTDISEDTFTELPSLKKLFLYNFKIYHLTPRFFMGTKNIEQLSLDNCNIRKVDADAFDGLQNLKNLNLKGNHLKELDFTSSGHLKNVVELILAKNELDSLMSIKNMPELKILSVNVNNISSVNASELKTNMPMLEVLTIGDNPIPNNVLNSFKREIATLGVTVFDYSIVF